MNFENVKKQLETDMAEAGIEQEVENTVGRPKGSHIRTDMIADAFLE